MTSSLLISRRDLDFILYEWLHVEILSSRARFSGHSRETFDAALDLYETLAAEKFAPHNKRNDQEEPRLENGRVVVHPEVGEAVKAFCESGLIAATHDEAFGGMQLPYVIERAGMAFMFAANPGSIGYAFLTMANANLLFAYGTHTQIQQFALPMLQGRFFGTMCLSEPQAGSSLADIRTRAVQESSGRYRLFGSKMWISGGDHELSENIVHLVLAKITNDRDEVAPGVRGLSLFIVPKRLLNADGSCGERNDVSVAGLNHKMGYRGTTNCALNLGEGRYQPDCKDGAVGFLLGRAGEGLAYMFHMMNEARIGVGLGAAAIGYTGFLHALDYARGRLQGRPSGSRDPLQPQIPIIRHPDVRRMLLAQKVYAEGALALALYSAFLFDESRWKEDVEQRQAASDLLDLLTPVTKSWPSHWALAANDLAIQVHGGYGYARDYNVEQHYRDNRLNSIHEGTTGVQALDLLGRKVRIHSNTAMPRLGDLIAVTVTSAGEVQGLVEEALSLKGAWAAVKAVTHSLYQLTDTAKRLANATAYLDAFGHVVVGWIWLAQAVEASRGLDLACDTADKGFYLGKLQACRYFFRWELPRVEAWLKVLQPVDTTCLDMAEDWF